MTTRSARKHWTSGARAVLRRALYWPDGDMRWALSVLSAVKRSRIVPDIVLTTSPPESAHLAGLQIKRELGAAWVAELRDSWIDDPLREELRRSHLRRLLERRIARGLLARADHVVVVSEPIRGEIERLLPKLKSPATTIGHFARLGARGFSFDGSGPHLLHCGRFTLSHPERKIDLLLDAFARATPELPKAQLHLVGRLTEEELRSVRAYGAAGNVVLHGEVAYDLALSMQRAADGLIVFQEGSSALPGKLSEYLLTSAPILIVGTGPWRQRLDGIVHFPLEQAALALTVEKRLPSDGLAQAICLYEAIFEQIVQNR